MKNNRSILVLAIIALVVVLGVGYAVVATVTLTINGTANVAASDLNVVFTGNTTPASPTTKVTAINATADGRTASFSIANMVLNDPVTLVYEVKNKETDVNATISNFTINNPKSSFFNVTLKYGTGTTIDPQTTTFDLNAQATTNVTVIVNLVKTPVIESDSNTTIDISFEAHPKNN